jgi:UDP-glucuronate 4-epimerase
MKILITGSCGFIGRHLCEKLLKEGHNIIGIDNMNSEIYDIKFKEQNSTLLQTYQNYIEYREDIRNENYIVKHQPDIVIHLAAHANVRKSFVNPVMYIDNNDVITAKVLHEINQCAVKPRLIYASSSSVYGKNTKVPFSESDSLENIISMYALSKKMCEDMAKMYSQLFGLQTIGLRFFTVYGPGGRPDMSIYNFLCKIRDGEEITLYGDGSMKRDFTFVEDIVKGICACITVPLQNGEHRVYNLGNNHPIDLNSLIASCEKVVGKKANVVYKPTPVGEVPITYADITKAKEDLGFSPSTSFDIGLQKTYDWVQTL